MSAPATKDFSPAPVKMATRTSGSFWMFVKQSASSSTVLRFNAFKTWGRLTVT
jgi:hypothetical protein